MYYQIFFSPQEKRSAIIHNTCGIYELPNDIRLRILGNIRKTSKVASFQAKIKILLELVRNS